MIIKINLVFYQWTNKLTNDIYIGQSPCNNSQNSEGFSYPHPKGNLNNFYEWFVGLSDGEASFSISTRNTKNFAFLFEMVMHRDEAKYVELYSKNVGDRKGFF